MKKNVLAFGLLLVTACVSAQSMENLSESGTGWVLDLGSFTGIVAAVSMIVTQLAKAISFVGKNKYVKIATSVVLGVGIVFACKGLQVTPFLMDMQWYGVLLYGVGAGLSACGFYDVVKPILDVLFKKKNTNL